jgi:hypothetical protein
MCYVSYFYLHQGIQGFETEWLKFVHLLYGVA